MHLHTFLPQAGAKKKGEKGKAKKGGKKSGGGRAQAILDGVPMAAMTRDQLEGHVTRSGRLNTVVTV